MNLPVSTFAELALGKALLSSLNELGYETPTPIQAASIPCLLEGRDLLGQAQTGTGKTAAFALPALDQVDLENRNPQIMVLTPTRELAIQVAEAFQGYARHMKDFHVLPVYGGQSMPLQLRQLKRGAHVIVGTPGRIMDHIRRKTLNLDELKMLVLDEADEMLNMGFVEDIEWILEHAPEDRQTALFSATMPPAIRRVAQKYLRDPEEIKITPCSKSLTSIEQYFWKAAGSHKLDAITRILEVEDFDAAIVFVRTKNDTVQLAEKLEARGFSTAAINGDMNQAQRERTIERLKAGKVDIVVATDVAARGLDVSRITHVFNYDIPHDPESYTHRIGRTGRAGRQGKAFLFVAPREMRMLKIIERTTKRRITPYQLPSHEEVTSLRVAKFEELVCKTVAEKADDLPFFRAIVAQLEMREDICSDDIAAALLYLAQKERPLKVKKPARPERADRPSRPERGERPLREGRDRKAKPKGPKKEYSTEGMVMYRLEVGRHQNVQPGDIVGAIANEAGLDINDIGHIKLHPKHSTVYLPSGMPKEVFRQLKQVRIRGHRLNLSIAKDSRPPRPKHRRPHKVKR